MRRGLTRLSTLLAVAVLGAAGCGHHETLTVRGTVTVPMAPVDPTEEVASNGDACTAGVGFADVRAGGQVVVTDQDGHTAGVGRLGGGRMAAVDAASDSGDCRFSFAVSDVEGGRKHYAFHVGGSAREATQVSPDQLDSPVELVFR